MRKAFLALSGGMDSGTLLGHVMSEPFDEVHVYSFLYGSKHNAYESRAAEKLCEHFKVKRTVLDVSSAFSCSKSNLLKSGGNIPEGHYAAKTMKQTVVPGRNLIFISILAGIAESQGGGELILGAHSGDHAIYPDCRPDFFRFVANTVKASSDGKVLVTAPYLHLDKTKIIAIGKSLNFPYHLTRTCYKDQELSCGKCGSCTERLEAFAANNMEDPIPYEH